MAKVKFKLSPILKLFAFSGFEEVVAGGGGGGYSATGTPGHCARVFGR